MIIAELEKKENIIEYIIYMLQIQDILRGNNFDIEKIDTLIINNYKIRKGSYWCLIWEFNSNFQIVCEFNPVMPRIFCSEKITVDKNNFQKHESEEKN